jgi:Wnt-binding factor required for Wnt secretion
VDVHFTAASPSLQWYLICRPKNYLKLTPTDFCRSNFSDDVFVQLLDPRDVRCYFPGHVSLCLTALLAVHLPWIKTGKITTHLKNLTNLSGLIFVLQNERHILTFYLPKVVIVGMLWMSAVVMATWQEYNELRDPTYSYKLDTDNFYVRNWQWKKVTTSKR